MRIRLALLPIAFVAPLAAVPLPAEVGLSATDPVGETRDGAPILPALDIKSVTAKESEQSTVRLTIETAGPLENPDPGSFTDKLSYVFSLDIDNDGFTGTNWGADFSAVLHYDIASKEWSCEFERHSEAYTQRMRITSEISPASGNSISVDIKSALFLNVKGGVWSMETRGDGQLADVIAPDRQRPGRIVAGESNAYDAPERQGTYFDNLPAGASLSRPIEVPDLFASIGCRLHVREFRSGDGAAPEVVFFFGSKLDEGKPFFGIRPAGNDVVAVFGLRGAEKLDRLALGKDAPVLGRDLTLRLERKGAWLAFYADDQLVGSLNARGLITNAELLTMQVTGADLRADQFAFAVEQPKENTE